MRGPERSAWQGLRRLARLASFSVSLGGGGRSHRERALALSRASSVVLGEMGLTIQRSGEVPTGPCVLVSNHLSWFDPLVVAALVPLTAVAKDDVARWPWVGARAAELGVIFVDRLTAHSGVGALLKARRALAEGVAVLNFPEGTTTHGDMVLPFRRGVFGLARLARVPVVPIRLDVDRSLTWAGPDPLFPHLWRLASTRRPVVRIRFGAPLHRQDEADAAAAEQARQHIARRLPLERFTDAAALCA